MKTKPKVAVATAAGVMVAGAAGAQPPDEESGVESSLNYDDIRIGMTARQLMDTSPEFSDDLRAARAE